MKTGYLSVTSLWVGTMLYVVHVIHKHIVDIRWNDKWLMFPKTAIQKGSLHLMEVLLQAEGNA